MDPKMILDSRAKRKMDTRRSRRMRQIIEIGILIFALTAVVGVMWDWLAALFVAIGGILFAICYSVANSYSNHSKVYTSDTTPREPYTPLRNTPSEVNKPSGLAELHADFSPFIVKSHEEHEETEQEVEDRRVRAILSQIDFHDVL